MRRTALVGRISEAKVFIALMDAGYLVSKPMFDGGPYDWLADDGERILRVQVKTGRLKKGAIVCPMRTNNGRWFKKGVVGSNRTYHGKADLIAIYCPETEKVYVFEPHQWSATPLLRVHPPLNNQVKGIRMAADYELKPLANPPLLGACEDDEDDLEGEPDEIESSAPLR